MVEAFQVLVELEDLALIEPDSFEEPVSVEVGVVRGAYPCRFQRLNSAVQPNELRHGSILPNGGWAM